MTECSFDSVEYLP